MDKDNLFTDAAGLAIMLVGIISLTESLLQVQLIGSKLPLAQGTMISLFTVSFGGILLSQSASEAFKRLRLKCKDLA